MHPLADARAWLMGRSAALTVRYGERLRYAGGDLEGPEPLRIPTRQIGLDRSRLAVSGFSAGGNLAASACLRARDESSFDARFQLLGVPSVDVSTADKRPVTGRSMITPGTISLVRKTYFRDAARRSEPYASPLLASSHRSLPPAMVITAERDALRAEGDSYAAALSAAGVAVDHVVVPGRDHYFLDGRDPAHDRGLMDRMPTAVADHLG